MGDNTPPAQGFFARLRCQAADWLGIGRSRITIHRVGGFPIYYKAKIEGAVHAGAKDALLRYLNERAAHHIIFTVEADEA